MKTILSFYGQQRRSVWLVLLLGLLLGWPAPLLADALLGIGVVGGVLAGALLGADKLAGATAGSTFFGTTECRVIETQGFVNGRQETLAGKACPTATGVWQFHETPRVVRRLAVQQEPQNVAWSQTTVVDPATRSVAVYPSLDGAGSAPPLDNPPATTVRRLEGGRYYGHRDFWPEQNNARLAW